MASSDNPEAGLPHSQSQPPSADPQPADQQSKKRSKQQLSCAECRRLKLKCDRDIPCSNCVRRGCRELCPDGVKETRRAGLDAKTAEALQKRLSTLEGFLTEHGFEVDDDNSAVYPRLSSSSRSGMDSNPPTMRRGSMIGGGGNVGGSEDWRPNRDSPTSPFQSTQSNHRRSRSPARRSHSIGEHQQPPRYLYDSPAPPRDNPFSYNPPLSSSSHSHNSNPSIPPQTQTQAQALHQTPSQSHLHSHPSQLHLPPISSFSTSTSAGTTIPTGSPVEHSHGTLVLGKSGRSRYLGPTAGTEWLKNQEVGGIGMETPSHSRSPVDTTSPGNRGPAGGRGEKAGEEGVYHGRESGGAYEDPVYSFPFNESGEISTLEALFERLPPRADAEVLVDSYYRYFAWNHDPAPRRTFQPIFDRVYASLLEPRPENNVHLQQLALVYMLLAMGTVHNIELPPHDESAEEYLALAQAAMTKGNFMNHATIAGLQTLVTMAHYYLETESGRNGDSAWPLWGLAMSLVVAMGLHRDGARWNLPDDVVQERRQVFWECHTIEVFQANCFSRPNTLVPRYIDTAFPSPNPAEVAMGGKGWPTLKFELCQISSQVLDAGMTVHFQSYDSIQKLYGQLCEFELNVPFDLRCRSALLALPSVYPDPEMARRNSPEISRHNLHRTLQQFTLSLNISENILFLQRPYFVMAMHDEPADPTRSVYGHSYLAVVERCNVIIQVVSDLYKLHPTIISRQWFFWYHLFTAAVCLGTLILKNPQSALATFALSQIEQAINVYSVLIKQNNSPSMVQNHDWLLRLQQRGAKKIAQAAGMGGANLSLGVGPGGGGGGGDAGGQEEEDRELLGWKTRLIERAGSGVHTAVNITSSNPASSVPHRTPSPGSLAQNGGGNGGMTPAMHLLQQHFVPPFQTPPVSGMLGTTAQTLGMDNSTDLLLHQFWDPMMMADSTSMTNANWWSWDFGGLAENSTPIAGGTGGSQTQPQTTPQGSTA
ncbi:hypothetical protein C347_03977 [Cryptococcus neoformans AD2-60a]|nr:hypothetical protein C347_03977 [Cryptococcus neoformans var. grubii AD2-60a]